MSAAENEDGVMTDDQRDDQRDDPLDDPADGTGVEAAPRAVDVAGLPDTALRSVLEFAIGIAAAGQKLRPPLAYPAALKTFFKFDRLDRTSLPMVRRTVVADEGFRDRLAVVAATELVDALGVEWLQRHDGWEARVLALHREAKDEAEVVSVVAALRKAERRREAAEQVAARTQAELIGHHDSLAREQMRREKAETKAQSAASQTASLRNEIVGLRREVDKLRSKLDIELARAEGAVAVAAAAEERVRSAEQTRDEALARRVVGDVPLPVPTAAPARPVIETNVAAARALQQAALATRDLSAALAAAGAALTTPTATSTVEPKQPGHRPARRKPIAIPGGIHGDSVAAASHLLRTPNAVVVVDGYNVAKLAWPQLELIDQRERGIGLLEDVVRRFGIDIRVVFDGGDVVGSSSGRRLIRVQYSAAGVSADDVIRDEVAALPARTPVVVVTNDQAIVVDVRSAGANVVSSDMMLAVAGRSLPV